MDATMFLHGIIKVSIERQTLKHSEGTDRSLKLTLDTTEGKQVTIVAFGVPEAAPKLMIKGEL
jgi:hypothetical protein